LSGFLVPWLPGAAAHERDNLDCVAFRESASRMFRSWHDVAVYFDGEFLRVFPEMVQQIRDRGWVGERFRLGIHGNGWH
jgi:hypothetical protein